jgi:hypothetical protein
MNDWVAERASLVFSDDELNRGIHQVSDKLLSLGITSVQDASFNNSPAEWDTMLRLKSAGHFLPRVSLMPGVNSIAGFNEAGLKASTGNHDMRLGPVKLTISKASGRLQPGLDELTRQVLKAQQADFAVAIHAVEQEEVSAAISALEAAKGRSADRPLRHRIEHCSQCPPHLLQRLSRLGTTVVSQPSFLHYNGDRYLSQVPREQQPWLYRFRSFVESDIPFAASSDAPVIPLDPLTGIQAATSRKTQSGQDILPHEVISPMLALSAYSKAGAWASGEENVKGCITPGMLADLALLSANPTHIPVEEIAEVSVEMTVLGGQVVWQRP